METTAFDTAHINVRLVHKRFDEEGERFPARPEGWVGADMRPQRLHQFEAATNICDQLRQNGGPSLREHAQCHIGTWPHHIHELFQGKVRCDWLISLFRILEQREGVAQWRSFANGEEQVLLVLPVCSSMSWRISGMRNLRGTFVSLTSVSVAPSCSSKSLLLTSKRPKGVAAWKAIAQTVSGCCQAKWTTC